MTRPRKFLLSIHNQNTHVEARNLTSLYDQILAHAQVYGVHKVSDVAVDAWNRGHARDTSSDIEINVREVHA